MGFDLFPGIVKYQSKKYAESDRVDYLLGLNEKSFCSVNNKPLKVDEAEMWYIALKYLFNDITLGQFDYMTVEMRYVIKQYMSSHKNRLTFLNSIKSYGFLRVISDVSKKLPREHIQKIMKQERRRKQQLQQQEQQNTNNIILTQPQPINQPQYNYYNNMPYYTPPHYTDYYNGNRLKRTISEPLPSPSPYYIQQQQPVKPSIIDTNDDIDDSWNFITEIVNENKTIPDLPPDSKSNAKDNSKEDTMEQVVDVYTMMFETMKDKKSKEPNVSLDDLTHSHSPSNKREQFIPKVNKK